MRYDWPGNARELNNIVQRAAWLAAGGMIDAADLDTGVASAVVAQTAGPVAAQEPGLDRDLKERERELILATLRASAGNRKLTAQRLGISPRTLRHKLQQFKAAGVNVPRVHEQQFMAV
jgi:two-component system response regulator FlrC